MYRQYEWGFFAQNPLKSGLSFVPNKVKTGFKAKSGEKFTGKTGLLSSSKQRKETAICELDEMKKLTTMIFLMFNSFLVRRAVLQRSLRGHIKDSTFRR